MPPAGLPPRNPPAGPTSLPIADPTKNTDLTGPDPLAGLTDLERALCAATAAGTVLNLQDAATDADRAIRADTIRRLLLGRLIPHDQIDPNGVQLTHAIIDGALDLDHITTKIPLTITHSTLTNPITAQHAHLATTTLTGNEITTNIAVNRPGMSGDSVR